MTNETLAQYANLGVYSAMVVFTIAMVAFAVDLAGAAPGGSAVRTAGEQNRKARRWSGRSPRPTRRAIWQVWSRVTTRTDHVRAGQPASQ